MFTFHCRKMQKCFRPEVTWSLKWKRSLSENMKSKCLKELHSSEGLDWWCGVAGYDYMMVVIWRGQTFFLKTHFLSAWEWWDYHYRRRHSCFPLPYFLLPPRFFFFPHPRFQLTFTHPSPVQVINDSKLSETTDSIQSFRLIIELHENDENYSLREDQSEQRPYTSKSDAVRHESRMIIDEGGVEGAIRTILLFFPHKPIPSPTPCLGAAFDPIHDFYTPWKLVAVMSSSLHPGSKPLATHDSFSQQRNFIVVSTPSTPREADAVPTEKKMSASDVAVMSDYYRERKYGGGPLKYRVVDVTIERWWGLSQRVCMSRERRRKEDNTHSISFHLCCVFRSVQSNYFVWVGAHAA